MGGVGTHAESVISGLGEGKDQTLVLMVDYKLQEKHMVRSESWKGGQEETE